MSDEADLMRKIQGLLAKAEGTDNEHESDAFFAKAHELMVKYAIDEERIRASKRLLFSQVDPPVVEDYMFSTYAHHAQAKLVLLTMVAKSQSVKMFPYPNKKDSNLDKDGNRGLHESQWTKFVGYPADISHVKVLYVSLLVQSQRFAQEDWRTLYGEHAKKSGYSDGNVGKFSWMSTHMEAFAERIGQRFLELTDEIYRNTAGANTLIQDKMANIMEWMYENGLARRPSNEPPVYRCWTDEPEENRPFNADGKTRSKRWEPRACIKVIPAPGEPHEGEHAFNYTHPKYTYSSYVTVGRKTSSEARHTGRSAADRADIGQPRAAGGYKRVNG